MTFCEILLNIVKFLRTIFFIEQAAFGKLQIDF